LKNKKNFSTVQNRKTGRQNGDFLGIFEKSPVKSLIRYATSPFYRQNERKDEVV